MSESDDDGLVLAEVRTMRAEIAAYRAETQAQRAELVATLDRIQRMIHDHERDIAVIMRHLFGDES